MSNYNKLAKNTGIYAIGNIGSKSITLLMLPFYTRMLSQADYGQIDIIITTIALLIPIFTVNIVQAVVRFSLDKKNYSSGEVVTNSLVFIMIGFIILMGLYPLISRISFIEQYGLIFYCLFFIQSLDTSIKEFTRSIHLNKVYMISDLLYTFVFVSFNILFIFLFKLGVKGYFISMILAYVFDLIFLSIKTKLHKYLGIKYFDKVKMKAMLIFCSPLIPNTIMWWVMSVSDRYILIYYMGLSANGLYAVANKFPAIISTFHAIFFKAWQVSAIEEYDSSHRDEYYTNVFNLFFFAMIIFSSFYMIFNKLIIKILVSNEFYAAWQYAPILVLGALFCGFSSFLGTNYIAMKKTTGALYTSLAGGITNILLNILLIPKYGIYGASIATMISFITMWGLRAIDTRKYVKIEYPLFKMTVSLILISIQLLIGYLELSIISSFLINSIVLLIILYLSIGYTKKPLVKLYKKVISRFSKHIDTA